MTLTTLPPSTSPFTRRLFLSRAALACAAVTTLGALPAMPARAAAFSEGGLAIRGYDPVAYFEDGAPVRGSAEFETWHDGATWRFASAENLAAFEADPARYAPQYGGYCAYAAAFGSKAPTDPDAWKIVEGKLYLNLNQGIQKRWEKDIPGFIEKADANWPSLR